MNFLKNKRLAVLVAAATPLLMSACSYDYGPRLFPVGYGYDNADYHVPPSAKPIFKRRLFVEKCTHGGTCVQPVASNSDMMQAPAEDLGAGNAPAVAGDWNYAAVDLVNRMVAGFGQPTEAIFLRRAAPGVVSEGDFYNALRQALTNKGVNLAHDAGESPFLMDYTISAVELSDASRQMLSVKLMNHGAAVSEVSGLYKVEAAQSTPGMPILPMSSPASIDNNNAGSTPTQLRAVGEPRADANDGMTPPPLMTPMAGSTTTETTVSTTTTETSSASAPPASLAPTTPSTMPMGERKQSSYN